MHLIIGTYRKAAYIQRALTSIEEHVTGVTKLSFVDDSGDPSNSRWLTQWGEVVETHGGGYNAAMQAVCRTAGSDPVAFWEEDFEAVAPIDLMSMLTILDEHAQLAQIALLRGPHFPIEHEHGGLLEGLVARLGTEAVDLRRESYGWSQLGTWTCNPAVWRAGIAADGWPEGKWTEDKMRDRLLTQGYRFGYLDGIRVHHDGERSGHGY